MSILVLVRHGQSTWNLEKRFTGWVDVDLTENGKSEAEKAGILIKNRDIKINFYYSSLQLRANNTLKIIQKVLNEKKSFTRAWQLNERHYGALTGLNKLEMSKKIGEDKVHEFRRSWNVRPEVLNRNIFDKYDINTFSITKVWNELLDKNELYGFESSNKFYHLTNFETFKKLQDL